MPQSEVKVEINLITFLKQNFICDNIFTLGVEDNLLNKDINSWGATGFSFWKIENLNKSCHDHKVLILAKEFYIKLLVSTLL